MKAEIAAEVKYSDVTPGYELKLGDLIKHMQDAAIYHTVIAGAESKKLKEKGFAWFMNKLAVEIYRVPRYREKLKIMTWMKGLNRFKTTREFEIFVGDQKVAAASSVWLYIDTNLKKITRVPLETGNAYEMENVPALEGELDKWSTKGKFEPDFEVELTTRYSDFDPNGHANNSAYIDYTETLIARYGKGTSKIVGLKIQFNQELDMDTGVVKAGLAASDSGQVFKIFDDDKLYTSGELILAER